MNLFVADPEWAWWIIGYFVLGGLAAGCWFVAAFLELFAPPEDRPLARVGYLVSFPLIAVCGGFLTLDLNRPERFWHMLLQSEVVHDALAEGWPWSGAGWGLMVQAPMLKVWSPMSVGAWALFVLGGFSFGSFCASVWPGGRVDRLLNRPWVRWPWRLAGSGVGFFVASYTGVLLTATNQPLWSQTDWLGPLFLASATSTSLAVLLLASRGASTAAETRERLERAELWVLCVEATLFVLFVSSLGPWLTSLLQTPMGWVLVLGPPVFGLLVPLSWRRPAPGASERWSWAPMSAVLLGGLLLRCAIVLAPTALLESDIPIEPASSVWHWTAVVSWLALSALLLMSALVRIDRALTGGAGWRRWGLVAVFGILMTIAVRQAAAPSDAVEAPPAWLAISPEDGRPRDGGPGASAFNRGDAYPPRSKIPSE